MAVAPRVHLGPPLPLVLLLILKERLRRGAGGVVTALALAFALELPLRFLGSGPACPLLPSCLPLLPLPLRLRLALAAPSPPAPAPAWVPKLLVLGCPDVCSPRRGVVLSEGEGES
jgi:hypothetical protein